MNPQDIKQLEDLESMKEASRLFRGYTCSNCGYTGQGVSYHNVHIGGLGEVRILECDDRFECWKRWSDKNG